MLATPKSSTTTLRFLDGTFVVISGTSVLRYMSDVSFIRFSVLAGAIYAAFLSYEFSPTLSDPQNFAVYALLAVSLLGWLAISSCLLFYFAKRNWVRAVFTPVIFLPIPMIAALVIASAAPWISSSILEFSELSAPLILRQLAVVVCLDMIHTRFVVPMHSKVLTIKLRGLFSLTGVPNPTNHPNPSIAIDQPSVSPIRIVQPSKTVAIGSQVFNRDSLVSIRVEKNGLNVTTLTGKTSTSATFAETVETLGVGLGMRINSTSWIAFNAILSMVPIDNNRIEIKMTNGDRLMVPKFRKHSFEQTYQLFRKAA